MHTNSFFISFYSHASLSDATGGCSPAIAPFGAVYRRPFLFFLLKSLGPARFFGLLGGCRRLLLSFLRTAKELTTTTTRTTVHDRRDWRQRNFLLVSALSTSWT